MPGAGQGLSYHWPRRRNKQAGDEAPIYRPKPEARKAFALV